MHVILKNVLWLSKVACGSVKGTIFLNPKAGFVLMFDNLETISLEEFRFSALVYIIQCKLAVNRKFVNRHVVTVHKHSSL